MKSRKLKLVTLLISYRIRDVFDVSTCYNSVTNFVPFFPRQNPFKFQCLVVFSKVLFDPKLTNTSRFSFVVVAVLVLESNKKLHNPPTLVESAFIFFANESIFQTFHCLHLAFLVTAVCRMNSTRK